MKFFNSHYILFFFLVSFLPFNAIGQDKDVIKSSVLVLSQDELFKKSRPGRALLEIFEKKQSSLFLEASKVEQEFILEEQNLTKQRLTLSAGDFQILADQFDLKVEKMRKYRTNKDKKLQQDFIKWRKKFVQIVLPIVRKLMSQFEASVVIDTINRGLIYDQKIDITDIIINKLNEKYLRNPQILDQIILTD